jgi:pilus assembly protein CpaF
MRLTVTRKDGQTVVYTFSEDPVHIGRVQGNQLVLPDSTVSKRHAAVYSTQEGGWMVEDFNSANKTYLNGQAVHKAAIRTRDCIKIADFAIEVDLEEVPVQAPDSPQ